MFFGLFKKKKAPQDLRVALAHLAKDAFSHLAGHIDDNRWYHKTLSLDLTASDSRRKVRLELDRYLALFQQGPGDWRDMLIQEDAKFGTITQHNLTEVAALQAVCGLYQMEMLCDEALRYSNDLEVTALVSHVLGSNMRALDQMVHHETGDMSGIDTRFNDFTVIEYIERFPQMKAYFDRLGKLRKQYS